MAQLAAQPYVSIIVACRNEMRYIGTFLACLSAQQSDAILEILIADGMSDDGTREALAVYRQQNAFSAIRIIDNAEKIVSTGLNTAIRGARGDVIIRMDAHTVYANDYVSRCLEVLETTGADNVGGPALTCADGFIANAIAIAYHTKFACGGARFHDAAHEGFVDTVPYGCWRKTTLERVGLFDERLHRSQDDDLNRRITSAGGTIYQSPKIISWYRPRVCLADLFHQYLQYGFWKVSVIRKHKQVAAFRHVIPAACVLIALALLSGAAVAGVNGWSWAESKFLIGLVSALALYSGTSVSMAFVAARQKSWRYLVVLPLVFATYHLAYGLGFLAGIIFRPMSWNRPSHVRRLFTAITR